MFEKATRNKLRWAYRGWCSVEDLWDLGAEDLDAIYKSLARAVREQGEDSLLETHEGDEVLALQIEIVKHIFGVKQSEAQAREDAAARKERKQRIMEVIAQKQDEELLGMTMEDLQKMVAEL